MQQQYYSPGSDDQMAAKHQSRTLDEVFTLNKCGRIQITPKESSQQAAPFGLSYFVNSQQKQRSPRQKQNNLDQTNYHSVTSSQASQFKEGQLQPQYWQEQPPLSSTMYQTIPYVQEGITNFWQKRMGNGKNSTMPKSQGHAKRTKRLHQNGLSPVVQTQNSLAHQQAIGSASPFDTTPRNLETINAQRGHVVSQQQQIPGGDQSSLCQHHQIQRKQQLQSQRSPVTPTYSSIDAKTSGRRKIQTRNGPTSKGQSNFSGLSPRQKQRQIHNEQQNTAQSSNNQDASLKNAKRIIGTGQGGRRIIGIGSLKDGSVLGGWNTSPAPGGQGRKKYNTISSQNPRNNPFVIQNMTLRDKHSIGQETEEIRIYSGDAVSMGFSSQIVNIDKSPSNNMNVIKTHQQQESMETMQAVPISKEASSDAFRKILQFHQTETSQGSSDRMALTQSRFPGSAGEQNKSLLRVPPLNVKLLKPIRGMNQDEHKLTQRQAEKSKRRHQQAKEKVEVINSASTAFRNFVKEKTSYLKGLDPLASVRSQGSNGENQQKIQLHAFNKKFAVGKARNSQKPAQQNINLHSAGSRNKRGSAKHNKTDHSPERSTLLENKKKNLKKPVLSSTKKNDDQSPNSPKYGIVASSRPSLENQIQQQLSTATLFNDRNNTNASYNQGRVTMTFCNKVGGQNVSQYNISPDTLRNHEHKSNQPSPRQLKEKSGQQFLDDLSHGKKSRVSNPKSKKVSAHDVLQKSPHKNSVGAEEGTASDNDRKMPTSSPTFKQLSEIFAFMDKQDFDEHAEFDQNGHMMVNMSQATGNLQLVEVRKRKKKNDNSPKRLGNINWFNSLKLGQQQSLDNQDQKDRRGQRNNNQRKAISMKPITGDPNNLSNRFFSLRRQRERRHETIIQIQKEQQAEMYQNIDGNFVTPRVVTDNNGHKQLTLITETDEILGGTSRAGKANRHIQGQNRQKLRLGRPAQIEDTIRPTGAETQLGGHNESDVILASDDSQVKPCELPMGPELANLLHQSLIVPEDPKVLITNKGNAKAQALIQSQVANNANYLKLMSNTVSEVGSHKQSDVASDTQDLGYQEVLRPIAADEPLLQKGSQSLIDGEFDYLGLTGQITPEQINKIAFDPKVKITGPNCQVLQDDGREPSTDGPGEVMSLNQAMVRGMAYGHSGRPQAVGSSPSPQPQGAARKAGISPGMLWDYFKNQPGMNNEMPLIVQQEAEKRQKEFARIGKDGRISFVGKDGSQMAQKVMRGASKQSNQGSPQVQPIPLELQVSQPWRTQQEQRESMEKAMAQMLEEERQRQQEGKFVVTHIGKKSDSQAALIQIRSQITQDNNLMNIDEPLTPLSPYNHKYAPNTRNMNLKPLFQDSFQQRNTTKFSTQAADDEVGEMMLDPVTNQSYFKVKVPLLALGTQLQQPNANYYQTNHHQMTERRQTVTLKQENMQVLETRNGSKPSSNGNMTDRGQAGQNPDIKAGSFRLKEINQGKSLLDTVQTTRVNSQHGSRRGPPSDGGPINSDLKEVGHRDRFFDVGNSQPYSQRQHHQRDNSHSNKSGHDNTVIDTGEFTYAKTIYRDQNGIGKNPMIRKLMYVPVCDKSMKKRNASKKAHEEWQRLTGTSIRNTANVSKATNQGENAEGSVIVKKEMGSMTQEDMLDDMQRINLQSSPNASAQKQMEGERDRSVSDTSRNTVSDQSNNKRALIKIQNQTLKQKQQAQQAQHASEMYRRLDNGNQQKSSTPMGHHQLIDNSSTAQSVFRVPYPELPNQGSQLTQESIATMDINKEDESLKQGSVNATDNTQQSVEFNSLRNMLGIQKNANERNQQMLPNVKTNDSRPNTNCSNTYNQSPRQSEMNFHQPDLVAKYSINQGKC